MCIIICFSLIIWNLIKIVQNNLTIKFINTYLLGFINAENYYKKRIK